MPYKNSADRKARDKVYYERHSEAIKEHIREYYHANKQAIRERRLVLNIKFREKNAQREREFYARLRADVLLRYGNRCVCCGENQPLFLEIDHIHNDGKKHRQLIGRGSKATYTWLKKNDYPQEDYQLLCANCNQGKKRNGGICPHGSN